MSVESLPLECLQLIIAQFYNNNDKRTLTILLRVNKKFCAATLPILYSNPFQQELLGIEISDKSTETSVVKLIRLLLAGADPKNVTELLRTTYDYQEESYSSGINYLKYLRYFHSLEQDKASGFLFQNEFLRQKVFVQNYLDPLGLKSKYLDQELDVEYNPYQSQRLCLLQYLAVDLRVHLTWALCEPALENIHSLVIPLSDIHRYITVVSRFERLNYVTFKLDKKLEYSHFFSTAMESSDPQRFADLQRERTESLEGMVRFVQLHTQHFPQILRSADCPEDENWVSNIQKCPESYHSRIQDFLPSLNKPRVIDRNNWSQVLAKISTTDLSQVQAIRASRSDLARWYPGLYQTGFLQRCRSLKELEIVSLNLLTFRWAADEFRSLDSWRSNTTNSIVNPIQPPHNLVPLEYLLLWSFNSPITNEVADIFTGFHETLQTFITRCVGSSGFTGFTPTPFSEDGSIGVIFGNFDQEMPRLRKLIIILPRQSVKLPTNLITRCPKLEYLEIEDQLMSYASNTDLLLERSQDWSHEHLGDLAYKGIKLQGNSAIIFNPELLHHTPNLQILNLGIKTMRNQSFIPHVAQMIDCDPKPSRWTWDWNLPNLKTLQLTGEFAWRFRFIMLAGCPNLENLYLNMSRVFDDDMVTEPDGDQSEPQVDQEISEHQRIIQAQDFLLPVNDHGSSNFENYLQVPNLKFLNLTGRWFLSDETLQVMLHSVMPNLITLNETQCLGFTIGGWIRATSQLSYLEHAYSRRIVQEQKLLKLGLAKYESDPNRRSRYQVIEEYVDGAVNREIIAIPPDVEGGSIQTTTIYTFDHFGAYYKIS
ncbi:hypothetical protein BGZ49_004390 [Haplosporangium sp. Z 27]|nr:hypothetical protein BGZ49_004390 [Haplosporangium sp. Z 27]